MNLELKKLVTHRGMEGQGYNAELYADGRYMGHVLDEGCGGSPFVYWKNPADRTAVEAYIGTLPVEVFDPKADPTGAELWPDGMKQNLETVLGKLVDRTPFQKRINRDLKKYVCFRLPKDVEPDYRMIRIAPTPEAIARVRAKYPQAAILNEVK